jgi:hypothetical protein
VKDLGLPVAERLYPDLHEHLDEQSAADSFTIDRPIDK